MRDPVRGTPLVRRQVEVEDRHEIEWLDRRGPARDVGDDPVERDVALGGEPAALSIATGEKSTAVVCQPCSASQRAPKCPKCASPAEMVIDHVYEKEGHNPFDAWEWDGTYLEHEVLLARCSNCATAWPLQPPPPPSAEDQKQATQRSHDPADHPAIIDIMVELIAQHGPMKGWDLYAAYADLTGVDDETDIRSDLNKAAYRAVQDGRLTAKNPSGDPGQIVQRYDRP